MVIAKDPHVIDKNKAIFGFSSLKIAQNYPYY